MLKVIIADDEQLICRLVQALADWNALGMEVAGTAENGLEALKLVESEQPDILITDIRMPGCNGLELIQRAKVICPQLEVVIISGYAHFEYARSAIRYGVGNYLLKPIKQEELMDTLRRLKAVCEERIDRQAGIIRNEQESRNAVGLLGNSFVKDLLENRFDRQTAQKLWTDCDGSAGEGDFVWQAFLLQLDCEAGSMAEAAMEILQEKAGEMFLTGLQRACEDILLYFQMCAGYGVLHYRQEKRAAVRKELRECLNRIDVKKDLFGAVKPSLALGGARRSADELPASMQEARAAVAERLIEGTGRLFEQLPPDSGADKQALLQRYVKTVEHAIETLDVGEADAACDGLRQSVRENGKLCGREVLELVTAAGEAFLARIAFHQPQEVRNDYLAACGRCSSVEQLFDVLRRQQAVFIRRVGEDRGSEASRPVRAAKQYVLQHFREALTLEEVCESIGFSPSYFSALFKKETGEGFAKYLTRIRMEEAKTLLRETNVPVAEICENVGYSDRKHFTHTFHKATGLNPAEYRKLYG